MPRATRIELLEPRTLFSVPTPSNVLDIAPIGTFASGTPAVAEIVAHDPSTQRLFSLNGANNRVDILSITNPASPTKIGEIPLAAYGAAPNSVAARNGIVAVAIEASPKTSPGKVAFFTPAGAFLGQVTVGALPDMLTFTPDGRKVLVANEGEPNSYGQAGSVDPEGTVSIIDLTGGVAGATVSTVSFASFNGQEPALRAQGVRIYGPGASAAQDFEPEYITVSADGATAYVTLQENNAVAVVDVATAQVTSLAPLGTKDFSKPTVEGVSTYTFENLPTLGNTIGGQEIKLGGFSGLHFEGRTPAGKLKFVTNTDRGPNGEPANGQRSFLLPDFAPEIVRFELDPSTGQLAITQRIQLKRADGSLLTGRPNTAIDSSELTPYNDEVPVDLKGNVLSLDALGGDFEGIAVAADGTFWLCDEYRPAVYHFDADGRLIDRFVPQGTAAAAGQPVGTFGTESLPAVLAQRRQNRGFEAVAIQDGKVYAFVQSPLRNPATTPNGTLNGLQNIRVVEFDIATKATTGMFVYRMDNPPASGTGNSRADKVGDVAAIGNGQFLLVERDDDAIDSDPAANIEKKIYRFGFAGATNLLALATEPTTNDGRTIDQMTAAELDAAGIKRVAKTLHVDLTAVGYNAVEKVEGLTLVDADTLAVVNDNDFQVAGITIDRTTGTFTLNPDYTPEPVVLGLIRLRGNGLDASDRDGPNATGRINIQHQPVRAFYTPDAIASYTSGGQTFLVTANEGDSRDYTGFAEEARVGASGYALDPVAFPNAAVLKNSAVLGRFTATNTAGNPDGDADFDQITAFGTRSFSIFDSAGKLVWDSGDALERITAEQVPALFNSDGTPASFDARSDNKGPEPEGVAIGTINGRTYAFVALERVGGIVAYDVTDPTRPTFVTYVNPSNASAPAGTPGAIDQGAEGIAFIPASASPTGRPLLAVGNEVSGTATLYSVDVNGAPVVADQTFGVPERSPAGTTVGTIAATDPNPRQSLRFEITASNAGGAFAIDSATGRLTVADPAAVDFDANPVFSLTVKVTDVGSPLPNDFATATVRVNVANVSDFSVSDATVVEGNGGQRSLEFTVTRDSAAGVAGVSFATADGTGTGGTDYEVTAGSLVFDAGQTSKTVKVAVFGDRRVEPDDTVFLNLSAPAGGVVLDGTGVGTIVDDDQPSPLPRLSVASVSAPEGNDGTRLFTFTIELERPSRKAVVVKYSTANRTAMRGSDYVPAGGTLVFTPGQTSKSVSVAVNGDKLEEADETFAFNLYEVTDAALPAVQATGTIRNDD